MNSTLLFCLLVIKSAVNMLRSNPKKSSEEQESE